MPARRTSLTSAESDSNGPFRVARGMGHVVFNRVPVLVDGTSTAKIAGQVLIQRRS